MRARSRFLAKELGLWSLAAFLGILTLPLDSCVTLSKLLHFSVPLSAAVNGNKNKASQGLSELTCEVRRRVPGSTVTVSRLPVVLRPAVILCPCFTVSGVCFLFLF